MNTNYQIDNSAITQGAKANLTGKTFELQCEKLLKDRGIEYEKQVPYTNLYGSNRCRIDLVVDGLHIECKFQNVSGSVDEKLPFCLHNLEQFDGGIVILGGNHWYTDRGLAIREWADEAKAEGTFSSHVITFEEFENNLDFYLTNS